MTFLSDERLVEWSAGSSTASPHYAWRDNAQETRPNAFAANSMASPDATASRSQSGQPSPAVNDVVGSHETQSAPHPGTAPSRMAYSWAPPNVGSDHIDPSVPQLIADLPPCLTIKALIYWAALIAVNRRSLLGDLLVALTCESRS